MKNRIKIIFIVSMFMLSFIAFPVRADMNITVTTDGDIDLDLSTNGDGALLSVDYNGRDLLKEIQKQIRTIENLRGVIMYYAAKNDVEDLQNEIDELDKTLQKLVEELNLVIGDIYSKVNNQAHVIGINPGNNSVAVSLIAGNSTISDYLSDSLIKLDRIDTEIGNIQHQINELGNENNELESSLLSIESALQYLIDSFNEALIKIWDTDIEVENLNIEIESLKNQLKTTRDSILYITIMFGVFSVIAIAIVAMTRRP